MNHTSSVRTALLTLSLALAPLAASAAPAAAQAPLEADLGAFVGSRNAIGDIPGRLAVFQDGDEALIVRNPRLDDGLVAGVQAGVRRGERLGLGVTLAWTPLTIAATHLPDGPGEVDTNTFTYELTLTHHWTGSTLEPFVGAGVGGETTLYEPEGWDARTDLSLSLLAGTEVPLGDALSARLGVRQHITRFESMVDGEDDRLAWNLVLSAGLQYRMPIG